MNIQDKIVQIYFALIAKRGVCPCPICGKDLNMCDISSEVTVDGDSYLLDDSVCESCVLEIEKEYRDRWVNNEI